MQAASNIEWQLWTVDSVTASITILFSTQTGHGQWRQTPSTKSEGIEIKSY